MKTRTFVASVAICPRLSSQRLIETAEKSQDVIRGLAGKDRAMLYLVAVGTGLRASEIASLTTGSLSLTTDPPAITVNAAYSKRRRRDEQPLPSWLVERLKPWLADRSTPLAISPAPQLLWPGSWNRHAAKMLRKDLQTAEIEFSDANGRVFDFHALRHQYISSLADAGVHPRTAQELARHSSIELTMKRYTHLAMRNVIGAVDSIPEPRTKSNSKAKATGTDGRMWFQGDARVTANASSEGQNCHLSDDREATNSRKRSIRKPLPTQELSEAEGTRLELATGFPAPHFQSVESDPCNSDLSISRPTTSVIFDDDQDSSGARG